MVTAVFAMANDCGVGPADDRVPVARHRVARHDDRFGRRFRFCADDGHANGVAGVQESAAHRQRGAAGRRSAGGTHADRLGIDETNRFRRSEREPRSPHHRRRPRRRRRWRVHDFHRTSGGGGGCGY